MNVYLDHQNGHKERAPMYPRYEDASVRAVFSPDTLAQPHRAPSHYLHSGPPL